MTILIISVLHVSIEWLFGFGFFFSVEDFHRFEFLLLCRFFLDFLQNLFGVIGILRFRGSHY